MLAMQNLRNTRLSTVETTMLARTVEARRAVGLDRCRRTSWVSTWATVSGASLVGRREMGVSRSDAGNLGVAVGRPDRGSGATRMATPVRLPSAERPWRDR